jgi:hypothetical protein
MLSLPATFMTTVCITYLLVAPVKNGGLFLDTSSGYWIGGLLGIGSMVLFLFRAGKTKYR